MPNEKQELWTSSFIDPTSSREGKPRKHGLTMVIDKGLGIAQFSDLLETAHLYTDYIKLGFGTSALYPSHILQKKIKLAAEYDISLYPGGTFFEVAYNQGKVQEYYENLIEYGFQTVEISDGTIQLDRHERNLAIHLAKAMNLEVITECGKKESGSSVSIIDIRESLYHDMEAGAKFMIVEGRESGKNVGVFNSEGEIDEQFLFTIKDELGTLADSLFWEAPHKHQQITFINHFGTNTNIGNVSPQDIYALESLRRGLRSDTFHLTYKETLN